MPSDHYYSDENAFAAALDSAFDVAARNSDSVVALAAWLDGPETEYGWLELGPPANYRSRESFRVHDVLEKPSIELARGLLDRGSVWNTCVLVGRVCAFVEMILVAIPGLLGTLRKTRLWAGAEMHVEESVYEHIAPVAFSRRVLEVEPARLVVLRVDHFGWSDLGHPERVIAAIRENGAEPWWVKKWLARELEPPTSL